MNLRIPLLVATLMSFVTMTTTLAQTSSTRLTDQPVLVGTEWRLVSFGNVNGDTVGTNRVAITLKFEANGRVSGFVDGDSYSGSYRREGDPTNHFEGNRIKFGFIIGTKRASEAGANEQERYFSALRVTTRFRLTSRELTLYNDSDRNMLHFVNALSEKPQPFDDGDPLSALNTYYQAINARDYKRAFRYWETPSQSLEQFIHGFVETRSVRLLVDPSPQIDGAAGSSYAKVASVVIGTQMNGAERVFAGCYVMRRSNVQAEDAPEQKGWRIHSANLAPVSGKFLPVLTEKCK